MTHEEKISYMKIAASIVGYGFDNKGLDLLVSLYDVVLSKKGNTDLDTIVDIKMAVDKRDIERELKESVAKKLEETKIK
jgi:hypothetical protein